MKTIFLLFVSSLFLTICSCKSSKDKMKPEHKNEEVKSPSQSEGKAIPILVPLTKADLERELNAGPKFLYYGGPFTEYNHYITWNYVKANRDTYSFEVILDGKVLGEGDEGISRLIDALGQSTGRSRILAYPYFADLSERGHSLGVGPPIAESQLNDIARRKELIFIFTYFDHLGNRCHYSKGVE